MSFDEILLKKLKDELSCDTKEDNYFVYKQTNKDGIIINKSKAKWENFKEKHEKDIKDIEILIKDINESAAELYIFRYCFHEGDFRLYGNKTKIRLYPVIDLFYGGKGWEYANLLSEISNLPIAITKSLDSAYKVDGLLDINVEELSSGSLRCFDVMNSWKTSGKTEFPGIKNKEGITMTYCMCGNKRNEEKISEIVANIIDYPEDVREVRDIVSWLSPYCEVCIDCDELRDILTEPNLFYSDTRIYNRYRELKENEVMFDYSFVAEFIFEICFNIALFSCHNLSGRDTICTSCGENIDRKRIRNMIIDDLNDLNDNKSYLLKNISLDYINLLINGFFKCDACMKEGYVVSALYEYREIINSSIFSVSKCHSMFQSRFYFNKSMQHFREQFETDLWALVDQSVNDIERASFESSQVDDEDMDNESFWDSID